MAASQFLSCLQALAPSFQEMIPSVAGSLITYFFVRGKARKEQFEKLKAGKMIEVANDLLANGDISHMEYVKCKNFLSIAKVADKIYKEKNCENDKQKQAPLLDFDLDWFIHFFESASNVSNEEIQRLWASVLAGEVSAPGSFSLRTIETLYRITKKEAETYTSIAQRILHTLDEMWFVIADGPSSIDLDKLDDLVVPSRQVRLLQECGLLNPIGDDLILMFATAPISNPIKKREHFALLNSSTILLFDTMVSVKGKKVQNKIKKENSRFFHYYPLTEAGRQLLPIIKQDIEYNYILQLGMAMNSSERQKSTRIIRAYKIISETDEHVFFETEHDLLQN